MSLKGSLATINIADIMQLYANSGQSGKFVLRHRNGQQGIIYFKNGAVIHAEVGNYIAEDAVFTLIAWADGDFEFIEGDVDVSRTISSSVTFLLMESAKRIDEWKLLRKKIGSIDSVPMFNKIDKNERRKISLSTLEWLVISKIDGQRTINQISVESGINIYDVGKMLFGMIAAKLITFKKN